MTGFIFYDCILKSELYSFTIKIYMSLPNFNTPVQVSLQFVDSLTAVQCWVSARDGIFEL